MLLLHAMTDADYIQGSPCQSIIILPPTLTTRKRNVKSGPKSYIADMSSPLWANSEKKMKFKYCPKP